MQRPQRSNPQALGIWAAGRRLCLGVASKHKGVCDHGRMRMCADCAGLHPAWRAALLAGKKDILQAEKKADSEKEAWEQTKPEEGDSATRRCVRCGGACAGVAAAPATWTRIHRLLMHDMDGDCGL